MPTSTSNVVKQARKKKPARRNPVGDAGFTDTDVLNAALEVDFKNFILPGFAGYAAARIAGRVAFKCCVKRAPHLAQVAGPIASAAIARTRVITRDILAIFSSFRSGRKICW